MAMQHSSETACGDGDRAASRRPAWFVSEDDVSIEKRWFARGRFHSFHRGVWLDCTPVIVMRLLPGQDTTSFAREADLWSTLKHPHISKLYGACNTAELPFFICEDATSNGNLGKYLARDPEHRRQVWRLLREAADAVEHLHEKRIAHGALQLNAMMVGSDGGVRVAYFGKARVVDEADAASALAFDVYCLGRTLVEAFSEGLASPDLDDTFVRKAMEKPPTMSDKAWTLVLGMTKPNPMERLSLRDVLSKLSAFESQQNYEERKGARICDACERVIGADNQFCDQCGEQYEELHVDTVDALEPAIEILQTASSMKQAKVATLLRDFAFASHPNQEAIRAKGGIAPLVKLLKDSNPTVQLTAVKALSAVVAQNPSSQRTALDEHANDLLLLMLRTGADGLKEHALLAWCVLNDVIPDIARSHLTKAEPLLHELLSVTLSDRLHALLELALALVDRVKGNADERSYRNALQECDERQDLLSLAIRSGDGGLLHYLVTRSNALATSKQLILHSAFFAGIEFFKYLVDHGANTSEKDEDGYTIFQLALSYRSVLYLQTLLKSNTAVILLDKDGFSPLKYACFYDSDDEQKLSTLQIVKLLCQHGAVWDSECEKRQKHVRENQPNGASLADWQLGVAACAKHWIKGVRHDVPDEVVRRGEASVETYLEKLQETPLDELIYRHRVCILGPSMVGKTSLVDSFVTEEQKLAPPDRRTIGVDVSERSFSSMENGKEIKHTVNFWDFAGQEIYSVTHSMFFSKRTLYLICVDLDKFAPLVKKLVSSHYAKDDMNTIRKFADETIFRWVRLVLARQPDAEFMVIGTKADRVVDATATIERVELELEQLLREFVEELKVEWLDADITQERAVENRRQRLHPSFRKCVPVTCATPQGVNELVRAIKAVIAERKGFKMPKPYTRVLQEIRNIRRAATAGGLTQEELSKSLILRRDQLCRKLIAAIKKDDNYIKILETLHDLGDVLIYRCRFMSPPMDFVFLDPSEMINYVREVVSHNHLHTDDDEFRKLHDEGLLKHSLLMKLPRWSALQDDDLIHFLKFFLQEHQVAYPAHSSDLQHDSDLIIPSYWNTKALRETTILATRQDQWAANQPADFLGVSWTYHLASSLSETIFVMFAVQSFTSIFPRIVDAGWIQAEVKGDFVAAIKFVPGLRGRDEIEIEVLAHSKTRCWCFLRFFVMSMEKVLNGKKVERYIHEDGEKHSVAEAAKLWNDSNTLPALAPRQGGTSWAPPDLSWYVKKAWEDPSCLADVETKLLLASIPAQLIALRNLIATGGKRRQYPTLWTLHRTNQDSIIDLRLLSDVSGRCYHDPIQISVPSEFFAKYGRWIKAGFSILSTTTSMIPLGGADQVISLVKSALEPRLEQHEATFNLLNDLEITDDGFSSKSGDMSMGKSVFLLRELLKIRYDNYDDRLISDISHLTCTHNTDGYYIWAHDDEIKNSNGELTPCDTVVDGPSSPTACSSPSGASTVCTSTISQPTMELQILNIRGLGDWDWHKTVVHWRVEYPSGSDDTDVTERASSDTPESWKDRRFKIRNATSVEMLRNATLHVTAQSLRFFKMLKRELGQGNISLEDHVAEKYDGTGPHIVRVDIPIKNAKSANISNISPSVFVESVIIIKQNDTIAAAGA